MKKYNLEKVLYFADRQRGLHVDFDELKNATDLNAIVTKAVNDGLLQKAAQDDAGEYFKTTSQGQRRLLELQINWRERNGKDTAKHHAKLAALEAENQRLRANNDKRITR